MSSIFRELTQIVSFNWVSIILLFKSDKDLSRVSLRDSYISSFLPGINLFCKRSAIADECEMTLATQDY